MTSPIGTVPRRWRWDGNAAMVKRRDTDKIGSQAAEHRWQAIDYAEGLVRVGVQSAIPHPGTAALLRQLMIDRGLPVPPPDRTILSICVTALCQGSQVW